jgi:hypothetical protein
VTSSANDSWILTWSSRELPCGEAPHVNVELVEARVVPVPGELNLELHLVLCDGQRTPRALSADAWPTPGAVGSAGGELAALDEAVAQGQRSRLDGEPADLGQSAVLMVVPYLATIWPLILS